MKEYLKLILLSIFFTLLSNNYSTANTFKAKDHLNEKSLAGVIKVNINLYCDKTEIFNVHWREYMFWTKKIFGENSKEYIATMPDTLVWENQFICLQSFRYNYLYDPEYNYFPIVGITQNQAKVFSKWRSDRVFERQLIENGIIEEDLNQNIKTYFSIEKYFTGNYKNCVPDKRIKYYPNYHLPSLSERKQVLQYADSIDSIDRTKDKSKSTTFRSDINPCLNDTLMIVPTISVHKQFPLLDRKLLHNIRGNVSEWAAEQGIVLGGSWHDSSVSILKSDSSQIDKQNCWTGFRNVCSWEQWNK